VIILDLSGKPITSLVPGEEVLVPSGMSPNSFYKMVVGDGNCAKGESLTVIIKYSEETKYFHAYAFLDHTRIKNLKF
jgi:hypothetical protein